MKSVVALAAAAVLVVAACSGGDDSTSPTTGLPISTTTRPDRGNVDGVLTIGLLLPTTGPAASLGAPMIRGAEMAVAEINQGGGVNDRNVRLLTRDEGGDAATARASLEELLEDGRVDAIVGPSSSAIALALGDRLAGARALSCSPSTTAIALTDRSDLGLFFRTMPSDELQGLAMARSIAVTGRRSAGVIYPDDDYGRRFAQALTDGLARLDVQVVAAEPYDPALRDGRPVVTRTLAGEPDVVAVIGQAPAGGQVLAALRSAGAVPPLVPTFVSDGMRRVDLFEQIDPGRPASVEGIQGTAPALLPSSADWFIDAYELFAPGTSASYASYAYDCVNLIALAAHVAGSDDPVEVAGRMADTSRLGTTCRNFVDCTPRLEQGLNIDLDGASGPIELDGSGDPSVGVYDLFSFDDTGRETLVRQVIVSGT